MVADQAAYACQQQCFIHRLLDDIMHPGLKRRDPFGLAGLAANSQNRDLCDGWNPLQAVAQISGTAIGQGQCRYHQIWQFSLGRNDGFGHGRRLNHTIIGLLQFDLQHDAVRRNRIHN